MHLGALQVIYPGGGEGCQWPSFSLLLSPLDGLVQDVWPSLRGRVKSWASSSFMKRGVIRGVILVSIGSPN